MNFYHKLKKSPESLAGKVLVRQETSESLRTWASHIQEIFLKYNIVYNNNATKDGWKQTIRKPTQTVGNNEIIQEALKLSKMSKVLETKQLIRREEYLTKLPLYRAALIFKSRCRMLNPKNNFKNGNINFLCELCGEEPEDDDHILERCAELNNPRNEELFCRNDLFRNDTTVEQFYAISEFLMKVEKRLRKL